MLERFTEYLPLIGKSLFILFVCTAMLVMVVLIERILKHYMWRR